MSKPSPIPATIFYYLADQVNEEQPQRLEKDIDYSSLPQIVQHAFFSFGPDEHDFGHSRTDRIRLYIGTAGALFETIEEPTTTHGMMPLFNVPDEYFARTAFVLCRKIPAVYQVIENDTEYATSCIYLPAEDAIAMEIINETPAAEIQIEPGAPMPSPWR